MMKFTSFLVCLLLSLGGCAPSQKSIEDKSQKLFSTDMQGYIKELTRYSAIYYRSAVLNYITNSRHFSEGKNVYLKKIHSEILKHYPEHLQASVTQVMAKVRKDAVDFFGKEMNRLNQEDVSVQDILRENENLKKKEFEQAQTNFRTFAIDITKPI